MHSSACSALVLAGTLVIFVVAMVIGSGCASPAPAQPRGGYTSANSAEPQNISYEEGGVEAVITAAVDTGQEIDRVGSFELDLTFAPDEILLYALESRVPEPLSLDFDPDQFSSGTIRILGVNTTEDASDGPTGTFEVARLSFAPAPPRTLTELREALDNGEIHCELKARAYGPLPDQQAIKVRFDIRFFWAVRRVE